MFIKFTRGSRKHRIGRAHAKYVLEIVALALPEYWLVIHVMPTQYRTGGAK